MTEEELYKYHEETFKPIYADLIATLGTKPEQIVFELEAALSHIAVAKTDASVYQENINKAHGHLQRAALDAVKIMWLEYRKRAEKIILDPDLRKFAANSSEQDLLKKYEEAEDVSKRARTTEVTNTGKNPSEAIDLYYSAAQFFSEITVMIDPSKVKSLSRFKAKIKTKEIVISFFLGVASSTLVTYIASATPT